MNIKTIPSFASGCCIPVILAGCAGTPEERKQMKMEGQALYSLHKKDCYDQPWAKHPANFQTVAVTRSCSRQIHTGMICIKDGDSEKKENCSNTYRSEPDYCTTKETKDLNSNIVIISMDPV